MTLFDGPLVEEPPSLEAQFQAFHAAHPEVFTALHQQTIRLLDQGHKRLSIGMLWEWLRMSTLLGEVDGSPRLNNNHRSRYARLLMESDPRLAHVFETRRLAEEDS